MKERGPKDLLVRNLSLQNYSESGFMKWRNEGETKKEIELPTIRDEFLFLAKKVRSENSNDSNASEDAEQKSVRILDFSDLGLHISGYLLTKYGSGWGINIVAIDSLVY